MNKKAISLVFSLIIASFVYAQDSANNILLKRIIYIKDFPGFSTKDRLVKLLNISDSLKSAANVNDSLHAYLLGRIARKYFELGNYLNAVNYCQQSIDIVTRNSTKPGVDVKQLVLSYYSLATYYQGLDNIKEQRRAFDSCAALGLRLRVIDRSSLLALYTKIEYSFDIGDYHNCISYAKLCEKLGLEYANNTPDDRLAGEFYASSSLAWQIQALLKLNDFETAEKLLTNRLHQYREAGLKKYFGITYEQLAEVQLNKGNCQEALSFLQKSLQCYKQDKEYFNCKQELNSIAHDIYFMRLNDNARALEYYKAALTYVNKDKTRESSDLIESLNIFNRIANVYVRQNSFDTAFKYFQLAFDQIKPGSNETDLLNMPKEKVGQYKKINYLSGLLLDKADAFQKQYTTDNKSSTLTKAIQLYKLCDRFLDSVKTGLFDLNSKLFWRSDTRRLYENAIGACYVQKNYDDAFYFFEKARATLLTDQLNEQHWVGENNILRQTQLEKRIVQLERELSNSPKTPGGDSALESELLSSKQEFERLRYLIKVNTPLYYQNFVEKKFIDVKDVKDKILNDHQALVELFAGDSAIYILVITAQRSYLKRSDKSSFDRLSASYTSFISHPDFLNSNFDKFKSISWQLYQLIFNEIDLPTGRIVFSTDSKYFPFEALVTNAQPLTYFLEDHAVSYTYSARYLLNNFAVNQNNNPYTFMGFAPVQYASALPELSGSDESLQRMQNYFSSTTSFIRREASKSNFLNEYYKYRIIQLYTHATDSGYAGEPMIYFSDSVLLLSDLFYERKPSTSLVVLSACETANGKLYNGEGVFSFSRQFAALGIPSSVSNLWQVDNQSTYKLTELFYKYLSRGLPPDVALQKAKKEFRKTVSFKEQDLPYYWAAAVFIGQSNPILSEKTFHWQWLAMSAVLFILLFFGIKKIRKNRNAKLLSS
jgi:CHAT domain-containing protein/tetratricopeptide (TPR) repeat protein